jgi:hypothetical protein
VTTRRQRAYDTERAVAAHFAASGWPHAVPVGAGRPGTDVTGMPGLLCEVKARRDFRPVEWLAQHALPAAAGRVAHMFVVFRPDGYGPAKIGSWGVMMRLDDFTKLLREAGYGHDISPGS